ncbi:uncharacterized protein LOC123300532 [Chrysoperla carnea]|uniref:uncharacterized protein LOC123300532 n=1 Tax=Chrysoperla carnea TaxID=189513 RepID=UPI001D0756D7|nr:uncharacterized protein LOC123300532 [Chrysoperla carnea]
MSLPNSFTHYNEKSEAFLEYFQQTINFLHNHEWIYNFPNTNILQENILNKFPLGWRYHLEQLSCQELNQIPFGFYKENWPESLKNFVKAIGTFKPVYNRYVETNIDLKLPKNFTRGLNPKKQHEIVLLSKFIHEKCLKFGITTIIDVGAGLGYISHLLHENYGYKVLAIESESVRFESALKRQQKFHEHSKKNVRFFNHYVNENSADTINNAIKDWLGSDFNEKTCLIGLHACADLTVTALNIFLQLDYIKLVAIMPCCYHKLQLSNENQTNEENLFAENCDTLVPNNNRPEYFNNFPLSEILRNIYKEYNGSMFLRRPFLRIACQSSASVWKTMTDEEHKEHSISHMRRAVLQLFVHNENYILAKLKRKCMNRTTSSNCDFETYLKQLDEGFYLVKNQSNSMEAGAIIKDYSRNGNLIDELKFTSPLIKEKITELWNQYENDLNLIEIITCFQNCIQGICENIIFMDRVAYLWERGVNSVVEKVTDDYISPRCHALIAFKE